MFFLERQSESINDRSEYLEQFSDTIMTFGFVNELEENIIDRPTNEGA